MEIEEDYKLENIDLEDIEHTIAKIITSLKITLPSDAFLEVKTFGDICEVFQKNIKYQHEESCTTQQAFYKIRNAIAISQKIDRKNISPGTRLDEIFPRIGRRKKIKKFQKELAIPVNFLTMKTWLVLSIIAGFLISLVAFFFNWKFALTGVLSCLIFNWIATKLQQEIELISIGNLAKKIARENYLQARRNQDTINKREITKVIQCNFIADHDLKPTDLYQDALLSKC
ncbi:hypothetical protein [Pedobacter psychrodurus]|uniref:hypothetical protein n=1 Tax=Pedobacter psychrodurus TaxID=2530456 RepID=UPI00293159F0|nr:hypothetical protein [Pedobacter psychrodurus]